MMRTRILPLFVAVSLLGWHSLSWNFEWSVDSVAAEPNVLTEGDAATRGDIETEESSPRPLLDAGPLAAWPKDEVAVRLVGGLADGEWKLAASEEPYQAYSSRSLAFTTTPRRYDSQGLVTNRPNPHLLQAKTRPSLPAGNYRFILRSKNAARLYLNEALVMETGFMPRNSSGHEPVPSLKEPLTPGMHPLPAGYQEVELELELEEGQHGFLVEGVIGGKGLRPEVGELVVAYQYLGRDDLEADREAIPFVVVGPEEERFAFTESAWNEWWREESRQVQQLEQQIRREAAAEENAYWAARHEQVRSVLAGFSDRDGLNPDRVASERIVDYWIEKGVEQAGGELPSLVDDHAFLRRLALDVIGVPPTREELTTYFEDPPESRRDRAVEYYLEHPGWADAWVPYWQDVLAENPGILKPELNNTGPFRWWIHESFLDNKSWDRFATELVMMKGSVYEGGPAGFALATQNDVPMAEKAHVLAQAFLGVEMSCARCHDAPFHPYMQQDLFQLAALLNRSPVKLPESSTVPVLPGGRSPAVEISLTPGDSIDPVWPFEDLSDQLPDWLIRDSQDPREEFAARLTSPHNVRFAEVLANRMWQRYLGWGIVSSTDDWYREQPGHPELLRWLAYELMESGYDPKHLARRILQSDVYQRQAISPDEMVRGTPWSGPARRRLTAEQVVDSLFVVTGKPFDSEPLTLDQEGRRPANSFLNLGVPRRAWEFTSLSNERDRPALALPIAQGVVDVLLTFGWRDARPNPITERDHSPTVLQPLVLANGMAVDRITRLSSDSGLTRLSLDDLSVEELVEQLYLTILSRPPDSEEQARLVELLSEGFEARRVDAVDEDSGLQRRLRSAVSWSNHLSAEATDIKLELERLARAGDPPTRRLDPDWRERMEDAAWALVTSPEFIFLP